MSAVSSESHEPASEPGQAATPEPVAGQADFGANEWLVEELYQRYLADPGSVDRAWWSFFADYQPTLPNGTGPQPVIGLQSAAPAAPAGAGPGAGPGARDGSGAAARAPAPPAQRRLAPARRGPSPPPRARLPPASPARRRAPRSAGCAARRPAPSPT